MMDTAPAVKAITAMAARSRFRPDLLHRVLADASAAATDGMLLQRFIDANDERAFSTILDRHGPMLLGLCRRLLPGNDLADDVVQATFLVLARKARSIRRRDNLAGWLYGVARRLIRAAQRSEAARRQRERLAARAEGTREAGWDDLLGVLDEELQHLSARYREPLLLCYLEGRTQDEAAVHLGWSVATVRRRLERGRDVLRARMVRRGATLGAGLLASLVAPSAVRAVVTAELRQAVLAIAASASRPAAVAPTILMLANGELRMALFTKCILGSIFALAVAAVLTASAWSTGDPPLAALQPPPPDRQAALAPAAQLKAPAPGRDLFGDPLPEGAAARLGTVELRHGPFGSSVQFTPDGKHLISLGGGWIRRWDLATGHARVNLGERRPTGRRYSCQLVTADGKRAIICRMGDEPGAVDCACTEYDLETGKASRDYHLEVADAASGVAAPQLLSPDGKLIAGFYREIRLWRTSDGTLAHRFPIDEGRFMAMVFAPDGKKIFAADDVHTIHVFDLASGKEQRTFGVPNVHGVTALAIAPDGKRLATRGGGDSFVRVWNVEKGTIERTLDLPEDGEARMLRFTPDSRTLIAGIDDERTLGRRAIRTWDVASGEPHRAWTADPSIGLALDISADGKQLATMNDAGVIRLWDMETGQQIRPHPVSPSGLVAVQFQPDGKSILTVGGDYQLRQWDPVGRQVRAPRPLAFHGTPAFTPGGQFLVVHKNEPGLDMVRVEDATTGQFVCEALGQEGVVSGDGKLLATSGAEVVTRIHDIATGKRLRVVDTRRESPSASEIRPKVRGFTADGRSLIVQGDIVSVWDVHTGKERSSWSLYRNKVLHQPEAAKFGGGPGAGFGGGRNKTVGQPQTGKGKQKVPGFGPGRSAQRQLLAVAVSPDGGTIAFAVESLGEPGFGGGQNVRAIRVMVFETMTGKLLQDSPLDGSGAYVTALAFSADGKLLAVGGPGSVRVWQVGAEKETWRFAGHLGSVNALAFSADARRLASASNDSTVLVWDLGRP